MNIHYLPLASYAANECRDWVQFVIRFKLFKKPRGVAPVERVMV